MSVVNVLRSATRAAALKIETLLDNIASRLFQRNRHNWPIALQTYRSYGTNRRLRFHCRALRDYGSRKPGLEDGLFENVMASYRAFQTDEIAGVRVQVSGGTQGGEPAVLETDEEGYVQGFFHGEFHEKHQDLSVRYRIASAPFGRPSEKTFEARCFIPSPEAKFGVISDIDDTVLHTEVTNQLRMLYWSLAHNALTRIPISGAAALYQELGRVPGVSDASNPFFYVSSSPWNLYSMLEAFLDAAGFPEGPLLLRDFGLDKTGFTFSQHMHKRDKAADILRTYPRLPFILLGDSGQQDVEIYSQLYREFPDRILRIYIRTVGEIDSAARAETVEKLTAEKIPLLFVDNSAEIAKDAREHGFIAPLLREEAC